MPHETVLILTLAGGLSATLVLGIITQKLRLSPLVGYLLAGVLGGRTRRALWPTQPRLPSLPNSA